MSMLELWTLLLLVILLVGIFGRRRFGDRVKLWLWRVGCVIALIVAAGQLQEQECQAAGVSMTDCLRAPITVKDLIQWLAMAGMLYVFYRIATKKVRQRLKGKITAAA